MSEQAQKDIKILVVDDDPFIREVLVDVLAHEGYTTDTAEHGQDGVDKFKANPTYGLVISDIDMPVKNGVQLIKDLRNEGFEVPIIVLSGNSEISVAVDAIKSGANDYLLKDENIQETMSLAIERVLEKQKLKEENVRLLDDLFVKNKELQHLNTALQSVVTKLTNIGTSLNSERNLNKLLEIIVKEVMEVTNADGSTLYTVTDDMLSFRIVMNKSMKRFMGGASGDEITFPPMPLSSANVSAHCAVKNETINIPDIYHSADYDFSGAKDFDKSTGYRTRSMLVLPVTDRNNAVVGVLQLLNAMDPATSEVVPFSGSAVEIAFSIACQAGVCIENAKSYATIKSKNLAFKRFVPTEFLSYMGKAELEDVVLGDVAKERLSVMFSDIRSFTSLSEKMTPEENFLFLNSYLKVIGPVIAQNGGFIDKYIGDAIMALFPGTIDGVCDDAVSAGIGMLEKLKEYNTYRVKSGYDPIRIGVGVHTAGTSGNTERMSSSSSCVGLSIDGLGGRVAKLSSRPRFIMEYLRMLRPIPG